MVPTTTTQGYDMKGKAVWLMGRRVGEGVGDESNGQRCVAHRASGWSLTIAWTHSWSSSWRMRSCGKSSASCRAISTRTITVRLPTPSRSMSQSDLQRPRRSRWTRNPNARYTTRPPRHPPPHPLPPLLRRPRLPSPRRRNHSFPARKPARADHPRTRRRRKRTKKPRARRNERRRTLRPERWAVRARATMAREECTCASRVDGRIVPSGGRAPSARRRCVM